jgi:hypothetical protein
MALAAVRKSIIMMTMALILTNISGAAPLTTAATIGIKHGLANVYTTATTVTTSTIVSKVNTLTESTDGSTINSSSYIAAHHPPSGVPVYTNQTYTLADTTGIDLPSSISTTGVKTAPPPALRCPDDLSKAATAKQLLPREIIGPNDIPMTTMKGVTSSVPYLRATQTITLPPTAPQSTIGTTTTEMPIISSIPDTTSTSSAAAATSTTTRADKSKERYRSAFAAALVVPCVLAACWTFGIVLYWRSQQPRPVLNSNDEIEMVPADDVDSVLSGSTVVQ